MNAYVLSGGQKYIRSKNSLQEIRPCHRFHNHPEMFFCDDIVALHMDGKALQEKIATDEMRRPNFKRNSAFTGPRVSKATGTNMWVAGNKAHLAYLRTAACSAADSVKTASRKQHKCM